MADFLFWCAAAAYILIGMFVFFVLAGDGFDGADGLALAVIAFWPLLLTAFIVYGVISAVAWLGCKLHDLIF